MTEPTTAPPDPAWLRDQVKARLRKISALASNPHWSSDRRWAILKQADEALALLQEIEAAAQTVARADGRTVRVTTPPEEGR